MNRVGGNAVSGGAEGGSTAAKFFLLYYKQVTRKFNGALRDSMLYVMISPGKWMANG
jgi:hypothetical protein